ncbi:hypothetical protein EOM86_06020 [Candidatus Nomurabacteria bacterium]|nr:hypothetical protein [Candidatus Nomurabacteria bacterium]
MKKIRTKIAFDGNVTDLPVVYITSGSNDQAFAPIGDILDGESQAYDSRNYGYKETRFAERSSMVIMSNSIEEASLIYHTLRAMLLVCKDTLSLQGLENIKFGGGDVRLEDNLIPKGVFVKALTLSYDYDLRVRSIVYTNHNISDAVLQVVSNPMPMDEDMTASGIIDNQ